VSGRTPTSALRASTVRLILIQGVPGCFVPKIGCPTCVRLAAQEDRFSGFFRS
jgi:hypothetical protein